MIKLFIKTNLKDNFWLTINPDTGFTDTSLHIPYSFIKNPIICQKCSEGKDSNHCRLLEALLPILVYFSGLISYENVEVSYEEENYISFFTETAQRACFTFSIFGMFYSGCEFFCKFRPLLKIYRPRVSYKIFLHFVLTTTLVKRQIDLDETHSSIDMFSEVKSFSDEIKCRTLSIINAAKKIQEKDAAVNALNTLFSLSDMSSNELKEYYKELIAELEDIPIFR